MEALVQALEPPVDPAPDRHLAVWTAKRCGGPRCQVCAVAIASDSPAFFKRYRICKNHAAAEEVEREGVANRFCQQCGRFHPLSEFDGPQRSCRSQLAYHAARRRQLRKKRAAASLASDSMTLSLDSAGGGPGARHDRHAEQHGPEEGQSCSSAEAGGPSSPFPLSSGRAACSDGQQPAGAPTVSKAPMPPPPPTQQQQEEQQQQQQEQKQQHWADWTQLSSLACAAAGGAATQEQKQAGEEASQWLPLQHSMLSRGSTLELGLGSLILQQQLSGVVAAAAPLSPTAASLFPPGTQQPASPAGGPLQHQAEQAAWQQCGGRVSEDAPLPSWGCKRRRLAPCQPAVAALPEPTPVPPSHIAALAASLLATPPAAPVLKPTPRLPAPQPQQQLRQPAVQTAVAALAGLTPGQLQGLPPATAAALLQLELEKQRCAAALRRSFLRQLHAIVQPQPPAEAPLAVPHVAGPPPVPRPFAALAVAGPAAAQLGSLLGAAAAAPMPARTASQPAVLPQQTVALLSRLASCLGQ
ncbi:hypothetical protein ABPG75_002352 [Micractinium tetrahymenae]